MLTITARNMRKPFRVWQNIYAIGGDELTHPYDCTVYLVAGQGAHVMIDAGAGKSFDQMVKNIEALGFRPEELALVIATHRHIDHIGSLHKFREAFGVKVVAHQLDAGAMESGMNTGAEYYGVDYEPCQVDVRLEGASETLTIGGQDLHLVHIPGHTPGGLAVYVDIVGKRVLFGQDVHGPYFLPGADKMDAAYSLQKLIDLKADILCEGHFGIYEPEAEVRRYIEGFLFGLYT